MPRNLIPKIRIDADAGEAEVTLPAGFKGYYALWRVDVLGDIIGDLQGFYEEAVIDLCMEWEDDEKARDTPERRRQKAEIQQHIQLVREGQHHIVPDKYLPIFAMLGIVLPEKQ